MSDIQMYDLSRAKPREFQMVKQCALAIISAFAAGYWRAKHD